MIDASENLLMKMSASPKEAVRIAEKYNANVEAELGYIAKLNQSQTVEPTSAEDAKRFVEATGIKHWPSPSETHMVFIKRHQSFGWTA
jgi:fructose-bisphosphate aldolase class II/tagatose 1,6-diphosphate aldolase GatY/KbaY